MEFGSFELRSKAVKDRLVVQLSDERIVIGEHAAYKYLDLAEINLCFVSESEYNPAYFLCRIYTTGGDHWEFRAEEGERQHCQQYRAFILALHDAVNQSGGKPRFSSGMRSKWGYKALLWGTMGTFGGLEALVAFAIYRRGKLGIGILLMLAIAVSAVLFYKLIRLAARPQAYDPHVIPRLLLPKE